MVTFVLTFWLSIFTWLNPVPETASTFGFTSLLFEEEVPLQIKIEGDLKDIFSDRTDDSRYFPVELIYSQPDHHPYRIALKAKTRGHFRLKNANCNYPPILLNFAKKNTPGTSIFSGQDKLKLVLPCRGDEYVFKEYLAYKIYNLVTDYSFRVRLVHIDFNDTKRSKSYDPLYGFFIEDQDQMATRNNSNIFKRDGLKGNKMNRDEYLRMTVFQYLIGNTDWSTEFRHNIRLLVTAGKPLPIPVPYDFDFAGLVSAPYAQPPAELKLNSVKDRLYRGFCPEDLAELELIFNYYKSLRRDIMDLIMSINYLDEKDRSDLMKYVEEFYKTLADPKEKAKVFNDPCLKNGTGNVVIQGLK